ncbi:MAG: type IV toxin-antitoxin system AbiEi family antitoxin domain-containing protein [Planctomycetes bacterium]|nr:type IV toxin-antitoxin system AbiEi family antitoxin domain-containing protein [Planctomycetota bacterium]
MLSTTIALRIRRKGPGWVFTPRDLLDLGSPQAVGMTLLRLARAGRIRKLGRGFYDTPRTHPILGVLHPRPEAILEALSRRESTRFVEHETQAANLLRLTDQVPARLIYLTTGRSRKVRVGGIEIELMHRAARKVTAPGPMSARVMAALRGLGKTEATPDRIDSLRVLLRPDDRRRLLRDQGFAPAWMRPLIQRIAAEKPR